MAKIILDLRDQIARSPAALIPQIVSRIYKALDAKEISVEEAASLDEVARQRQSAFREAQTAPGGGSSRYRDRRTTSSTHRSQRPPDRIQMRFKRRSLARARWMPDHLADHFTDGEIATMVVLAEEQVRHGVCDLPVGEIAALAGVSESTARNGLRAAQVLGLITIEHRPRPGQPSLTNLVKIVSFDWLTWIKRRPASWRRARGGGCKRFKAKQEKGFISSRLKTLSEYEERHKGYREGSSGRNGPN